MPDVLHFVGKISTTRRITGVEPIKIQIKPSKPLLLCAKYSFLIFILADEETEVVDEVLAAKSFFQNPF